MGQFELGDFEDGDRPVADEAAAVAGNGDTDAVQVDPGTQVYTEVDDAVEMAVTQVDYTVEGRGDDETPVINVFGRTRENDLVHVRVHDFRPYFYAPAESVTEGRLREYDRVTGWEETDTDGEPYESIRGERLVKIFGQTPRDVGQIRDDFDHFEADILFPNRFLIDKDVTSGIRVPAREIGDAADRTTLRVHHEEVQPVDVSADLRVNTFDIEVDDRSGFPEDGEEPIICLTSHDSYRDEYVVWLYEPPAGVAGPESLECYEPVGPDFEADVRTFDTEEAMLAAFLDYIEETDVDLMTGWNFADFDAPYLIDRLEELDAATDRNLDYNRLSRVDEVWRSDWQGPDVKGRVVFDLLYAYQRTQFTELESYRLDAVGEQELGVGKERYSGDIGDLWEQDPERLLEYNLRDVELCVELDREQDIVDFWDEVRRFVGCKIEDATTPGDAVDMYVLHKLHGEFALPSKGQQASEEYEGGAVFDPITGVRENVSVLDLRCFSDDTEVLTPEGAKNIVDIEVGDPVYTLDPETFECEVKPVVETQEYENRFGELHHLSGNTHDFKVTENHRFLVSSQRGWDGQTPDDFQFEEYRDITDGERFAFPQHEPMDGRSPEQFRLVDEVENGYVVIYCEDDLRSFRNRMPESVADALTLVHGSSDAPGRQKKTGKYLVPVSVYRDHREVIDTHADHQFLKYGRRHGELPPSFGMENWLELLGWFVTAESTYHDGGAVTIHQNDGSEREAICQLLDRMGVGYSTDERGVNISGQHLVEWLEANCGTGCADKRLPAWVFTLDSELLRILLDTMVRGDGQRVASGIDKFWTKSETLKDDIVDLAVRCGEKPTVSRQSDGTWYVSTGKKGSFKKATNATAEAHDGSVHCLTARDNHVILAGRNGQYQWVGQSLYPMCMVTTNASPETKVDPERYDGETYRAPNGTHFRKEPDGVIREMVDELLSEREEKKSLRNEHDPDTREYEQYDRQQAAVKVIMNCFTPDTEVLTPEGVRGIRDLEVGDDVYSLDPETTEMELKPVVETHAYPDYRGELVDIQTSEIDFRVTPNHRMLVRKNDKNGITEDEWSFVEAGELDDDCHYELPHDWEFEHEDELGNTVDIRELIQDRTDGRLTVADGGAKLAARSGKPNVSRTIPTADFLELLAWYITEGSVYEPKTGNYRVKFAQSTDVEREEIEELVDSVVDYYYETDRKVSFSSRILADLFRNLCGDGSENKRIPNLVFRASREQKELFLDTLIKGDGDRQPNSWRFTTSSEQLRDDVLCLCTHLGLTASYNRDSGSWRVYCTENAKNSFRTRRSGSRSTAENGVYCVTVADNHTLVAGRNGKFQNVSQSLYGVLGWDRFRLYDKEMGAAVTATGREVIEYTDEVVQDEGYETVYGDSVTGDRPIVVRDPDGRVRIRSIESLFEKASEGIKQAAVAVDGGAVDGKARRQLGGWDALSVTDDGSPEWRSIEGVIRHETDKPVVTLQHRFGESTTTTDHSYVVEDEDGFVEKQPSEVESPLRVPSVPDVESVESIDVYEVLQGYTRAYEDGRSAGSESPESKIKRVHTDGECVWFGHEHHDACEQTVKVRRHIDIDSPEGESLVRLLAAYVTGGTASTGETTDSRFGASIAETRRDWLEGLQDDYHALFTNTDPSVVASDTSDERSLEYETSDGQSSVTCDDRTLKLQMMNELAAVFFREFAGQTSRGKRLPEFVFHLPAEKQTLFLDVLVEGDGSRQFPRYSEEYSERNFEFETTSRELAAGLSILLTQRDRKHSLNYRNEKDTYTVRTCECYRSGRDPDLREVDHDGYVYDLSVTENENFVDAVGGVVLHNTDSVMLEVGDIDSSDIAGDVEVTDGMREKHPEMTDSELETVAATIQEGFELEERINDSYDEFALERLDAEFHRFEIEFEKLYRRFFQAGKKKRYAGHIVWKEGKDVDDIDITGFEYQRSDIAPITKEVQHEVIEMIVHGEDIEDVESYLHEVIEDFRAGDVSVEEVGIPGGIGKRLDNYDTDTAQVRGAKYANLLLGTNFQRGSKPKRLYLEKVHPDFFERLESELGLDPAEDALYGEFRRDPDVICFEYEDQIPAEFVIDWDKMLEKTLKGPIARILEALEVSWEEVKSGQEQTGLGQYM